MFTERKTIKEVEEGNKLSPKFNSDGYIPVVTTDTKTGKLLMHAYMNDEALKCTIEKKEAYYYSRSRKCIWHKGSTSGFVQKVDKILIDDDQDCVWLQVTVSGDASCHVGYRSCFYREIKYDARKFGIRSNPVSPNPKKALAYNWNLIKFIRKKSYLPIITEKEKVFDPDEVYGDAPNPTIL